MTRIDPIAMLFWSAVINGVVAVPIMIAVMLVVSKVRGEPISRCPRGCGPPPMKWSDSKYGFATEEDCNGEEAQA